MLAKEIGVFLRHRCAKMIEICVNSDNSSFTPSSHLYMSRARETDRQRSRAIDDRMNTTAIENNCRIVSKELQRCCYYYFEEDAEEEEK